MEQHSIGKTIAKLRKEKDWTQLELAEKLNVSDKTISKWENEAGLPEITQFPALASIFGISIDYLMTGKIEDSSISLNNMDAGKRAIILAEKDDLKNFEKYGHVTETVLLDEQTRRSIRSNVSYNETMVKETIFTNQSKKIFKACAKKFLPYIKNRIGIIPYYDPHKILNEDYRNFFVLSVKSGFIEGLNFLELKHYISDEIEQILLSSDVPNSVYEYLTNIEFTYEKYEERRKQRYCSSSVNTIVNILFQAKRYKQLETVLSKLYKHLQESNHSLSINETFSAGTIWGEEYGYSGKTVINYVPFIHLDFTQNNFDLKWLRKFNDYNKKVSETFCSGKGGYFTEEDIQSLIILYSSKATEDEKFIALRTRLRLFNFNQECMPNVKDEQDPIKLKKALEQAKHIYKDIISPSFIHYMELVETYVTKKKYKELFEFASDYGLKTLEDAALSMDNETIIACAKELFLPPSEFLSNFINTAKRLAELKNNVYNSEIRELNAQFERSKQDYLRNLSQKNKNLESMIDRQMKIVSLLDYCNVQESFVKFCSNIKKRQYDKFKIYVEEKIEKLTNEKKMQEEYINVVNSISNQYLQDLLDKGDYEVLIVKLCSRLDAELKYKKYEGEDFFSRMDDFFKKHVPESRQRDDGWGYMELDKDFEENQVKPWKARQNLFNRLRMQRNNIVHLENDAVNPLSEGELKECLQFITSIE